MKERRLTLIHDSRGPDAIGESIARHRFELDAITFSNMAQDSKVRVAVSGDPDVAV